MAGRWRAVHQALDQLQPVHVPFRGPVAPLRPTASSFLAGALTPGVEEATEMLRGIRSNFARGVAAASAAAMLWLAGPCQAAAGLRVPAEISRGTRPERGSSRRGSLAAKPLRLSRDARPQPGSGRTALEEPNSRNGPRRRNSRTARPPAPSATPTTPPASATPWRQK